MHEQIKKTLRAAEAVLARKTKIETAINEQVAGLEPLIKNQIQTERDFRRLECQAAIGEKAPRLGEAKKAAADARAALETASAKLAGWRRALGEQGNALVEKYNELDAAIPQYNATVAAAFAAEWEAALAAWNLLLGKRQQLEQVLGQSIELDVPVPTLVEIGDTGIPHATLAELGTAIKSIGNMKSIAERQLKPGLYDASKIYKLVSDRLVGRGLPKGSLVIDASLESGRLAQFVEFEEARPIRDSDVVEGVNIAASKSKEIEAAHAAKHLADSEARLHVPFDPGKQTTRQPDAGYSPTQADLDKAARSRELIDAHVPLTTTRGY